MSVAVIAFRHSPRFPRYSRETAGPRRSRATISSRESSDLARAPPKLHYLTAWDHERLVHKSIGWMDSTFLIKIQRQLFPISLRIVNCVFSWNFQGSFRSIFLLAWPKNQHNDEKIDDASFNSDNYLTTEHWNLKFRTCWTYLALQRVIIRNFERLCVIYWIILMWGPWQI